MAVHEEAQTLVLGTPGRSTRREDGEGIRNREAGLLRRWERDLEKPGWLGQTSSFCQLKAEVFPRNVLPAPLKYLLITPEAKSGRSHLCSKKEN